MSRIVSLVFLTVVVCIGLRSALAEDKRQYFDSLGGMALGKRSEHVNKALLRFFHDPVVRGLLVSYLDGDSSLHKRTILDALGGDYLIKRGD